jgi:hypothetical protein
MGLLQKCDELIPIVDAARITGIRRTAGAVSKRAASAAVATLEKALDDPKTPHYVRIKAAMALLDFMAAQANKPEPEKVESKIIILPDNGRGRIAEARTAGVVDKPEQPAEPKPKKVIYLKGKRR